MDGLDPVRQGLLRNWASTGAGKDSSWSWLFPDWWRSLWHYESEVYTFHVNLTSGHTYESNPWSWIVLGRPVSYFYESPAQGTDGCPADAAEKCAREVLAIGTPLLWWTACFALLYVLWRWLFRRDWRAGAIACAVAAGWAPWFLYQERTIFLFYAVVFVPFLCLAVAMLVGAMLGRPAGAAGRGRRRGPGRVRGDAAHDRRHRGGRPGTADHLELPLLPAALHRETIPMEEWRGRMWLDTWV